MIKGSCHCGAVQWTFEGQPESATACNCTVCRRYGTLWAYDYENEGIEVSGPTSEYIRGDRMLAFHFCPTCGCVTYWRGIAEPDERRRIAVNLRLAEPDDVGDIPIRHFEGLVTFMDLEPDGRCVSDMWF